MDIFWRSLIRGMFCLVFGKKSTPIISFVVLYFWSLGEIYVILKTETTRVREIRLCTFTLEFIVFLLRRRNSEIQNLFLATPFFTGTKKLQVKDWSNPRDVRNATWWTACLLITNTCRVLSRKPTTKHIPRKRMDISTSFPPPLINIKSHTDI